MDGSESQTKASRPTWLQMHGSGSLCYLEQTGVAWPAQHWTGRARAALLGTLSLQLLVMAAHTVQLMPPGSGLSSIQVRSSEAGCPAPLHYGNTCTAGTEASKRCPQHHVGLAPAAGLQPFKRKRQDSTMQARPTEAGRPGPYSWQWFSHTHADQLHSTTLTWPLLLAMAT